MIELKKLTLWESAALLYVEKYGIIDYKVNAWKLVYYEKYPNEGTFKHVIDLRDMSHTSKKLYERRK